MCRMASQDTDDTRYIREWMTAMGWDRHEAARQLGLSPWTFYNYLRGCRNDGEPQSLPDTVYLAMECLRRTTIRLDLSQPPSSKRGKWRPNQSQS